MANTLDKELNEYITQLNEAEKKSVLLMLKTFLSGRQASPERISLEDYNKEIDEALAEAEAGDYITQEEMEKRAAKW
jgi:predicted transcriptional regulator